MESIRETSAFLLEPHFQGRVAAERRGMAPGELEELHEEEAPRRSPGSRIHPYGHTTMAQLIPLGSFVAANPSCSRKNPAGAARGRWGTSPPHGLELHCQQGEILKKKKRAEKDGLELFLLLLTHHCIESGFLPGFGGSRLDLHWEWGVWQLGDVPARAPTPLLPCPLFFLLLPQPSW